MIKVTFFLFCLIVGTIATIVCILAAAVFNQFEPDPENDKFLKSIARISAMITCLSFFAAFYLLQRF